MQCSVMVELGDAPNHPSAWGRATVQSGSASRGVRVATRWSREEISERHRFRRSVRLGGDHGQAGAGQLEGDLQARATREGQLAQRPLGDDGERDRRKPRATVANSAARSAHIARPNDTFSTSAPGTMVPSAQRTAAPMWKSL